MEHVAEEKREKIRNSTSQPIAFREKKRRPRVRIKDDKLFVFYYDVYVPAIPVRTDLKVWRFIFTTISCTEPHGIARGVDTAPHTS